MEDRKVHSTFIPKETQPNRLKRSPMGFLMVFGVAVLLLSLLGWGFAYLRVEQVMGERDQAIQDLEKTKKSFEPNFLRDLEILDQKLTAAKTLLDEHVALSPFFAALEAETLVDVTYSRASISEEDSKFHVSLSGLATGYEAIALQSDALAASHAFINPIFSGLSLQTDNSVSFSLDMILNHQLTSYRNTVQVAIPENPDNQTSQ